MGLIGRKKVGKPREQLWVFKKIMGGCAVPYLVTQSCLTLCDPMDCSPPSPSVHGDSPGKNNGVGCHVILQGIKPRSPALQVDSSPPEPPGKPKNTGVGSLSLLQGVFLTQESNPGLLHCRQILYQLSCKGSPYAWLGVPQQSTQITCRQV